MKAGCPPSRRQVAADPHGPTAEKLLNWSAAHHCAPGKLNTSFKLEVFFLFKTFLIEQLTSPITGDLFGKIVFTP